MTERIDLIVTTRVNVWSTGVFVVNYKGWMWEKRHSGQIMELLFPHTFTPGNESSIDGTFALWNFWSRELSFLGTFIRTVNVTWFRSPTRIMIDKLMVLRRYSLFVSLYSFIVVKDGRI